MWPQARPGYVEIAAFSVGSNVIEPTIASTQLNLENLVRTAILSVGQASKREHDGECCDDGGLAYHKMSPVRGSLSWTISVETFFLFLPRPENTRTNLKAG